MWLPADGGINGQAVQDPRTLRVSTGPLEFDIMRRLVTSYLYELPFGRGKRFLNGSSRAVDLLLGGWQVNGITTFQGGFPLTPVLSYSEDGCRQSPQPDRRSDRLSSSTPSGLIRRRFPFPQTRRSLPGISGNQGVGVVRSWNGEFDFSFSKAVCEGMPIQSARSYSTP